MMRPGAVSGRRTARERAISTEGDTHDLPSPRPGHAFIEGRQWRVSDPSIPEPLRRELVGELMAARRAVGAAKRAVDPGAERRARDRVQVAKVALGERGPKWWEGHDEAGWRARIEACLLALLRARDPDASVCPSDVARAAGGSDWRARMAAVREAVAALEPAGRVEVRRGGERVPVDAAGAVRLGRGRAFGP